MAVHPPKLARWILGQLSLYEELFLMTSDLEDEYAARANSAGKIDAGVWYWRQTFRIAALYFRLHVSYGGAMFLHHLKIAWRVFKRDRFYSLLNTMGLAVGLTGCLLVLLFVQYEISFDRYHPEAENIFRVVRDEPTNIPRNGTTVENACPAALAEAMRGDVPEVRRAARIRFDEAAVRLGEDYSFQERFFYADRDFFEIFSFPFVAGNPKTALQNPFSLVITQDVVDQYFGHRNPLGQTVQYHFEFLGQRIEHDLTITGVLKNIPKNSHFTFQFVASVETLYRLLPSKLFGWGDGIAFKTYILMGEKGRLKEVEEKLTRLFQANNSQNVEYQNNRLYLQPLKDIHLGGNVQNEISANSTAAYLAVFIVVAFSLMAVACLNYINLSTARSLKRANEVGIRKATGADRKTVFRQFFLESFLYSLISLAISVAGVFLFLPEFNRLVDRDIKMTALNPFVLASGIAALTIFMTLVSGFYPAIWLSSLNPSKIISAGRTVGSHKKSTLRNLFVTFQFVVSFVFVACSLLASKQFEFIREKNLGYEKDHVICLQSSPGVTRQYGSLKEELMKNPGIQASTLSSSSPVSAGGVGGVDWEGKTPADRIPWFNFLVDDDFLQTLKLTMSDGRFFSRDRPADAMNYVLNETAVKTLGWTDPIGKTFSVWRKKGQVIGVVKDFHFRSLHEKIQPLVLRMAPEFRGMFDNVVLLRVNTARLSETIEFIKRTIGTFDPASPFRYAFLDDTLDGLYRNDRNLGQAFNYFSLTAALLSCLGLFGLLSYTIERRTKEIGIRKVLGASVLQIVRLVSRSFFKCVLAANILAWPLAYGIVKKWLQKFEYQVPFSLFSFLIISLLMFAIAVLSMGWKMILAARMNPAKSLRHE